MHLTKDLNPSLCLQNLGSFTPACRVTAVHTDGLSPLIQISLRRTQREKCSRPLRGGPPERSSSSPITTHRPPESPTDTDDVLADCELAGTATEVLCTQSSWSVIPEKPRCLRTVFQSGSQEVDGRDTVHSARSPLACLHLTTPRRERNQCHGWYPEELCSGFPWSLSHAGRKVTHTEDQSAWLLGDAGTRTTGCPSEWHTPSIS